MYGKTYKLHNSQALAPAEAYGGRFVEFAQLFLSYFSNIYHFLLISHLFLKYFPVVSRLFPISRLFLIYFLFVSRLRLFLNHFPLISQIFLTYFSIISHLFLSYFLASHLLYCLNLFRL